MGKGITVKALAWCTAGLLLLVAVLVPVIALGARSAEPSAGNPLLGNLNSAKVPEEYRAYIEAAGKVCVDVPAAAIAAQIQQESGWNPKAVSPVGAQGLTQFMPGTWQSLGRDVDGNGKASPFDPADAIHAQARYMCQLAVAVKPYAKGGTPVIELAWAAYNAGPGAVAQHGGVPPYAETQKYVSILRSTMSTFLGDVVKAGGKWAAPLSASHLIPTSGFGPRGSPCGGCSSNHQGQDFGAPSGAPIHAACSGIVDFAGQMSGYGNITFINCGGGVRTGYAHQSAIGVTVGQKVTAGTEIGKVGATGVGTGAHLHFEVRTGAPAGGGGLSGTPVSPTPFMRKQGITW